MPTIPSPLSRVPEAENQPRLIRRLGAHERLLHHYAAAHPRHFCVVAEFGTSVRKRNYRAAFAMIQRRHPLLSAFVDETEGGPAYFHADTAIDVTLAPQAGEDDWQRAVERELATPFPDDKGPLLRVLVLEGGARDDIVILTFHHAAADALSGAFIIQDLMDALAGRALMPLRILPPLENLAQKALLPRGGKRVAKPQTPEEIEALRAIARAPLWRPFEGDRPVAAAIRFDRQATDCVLRACRTQKTTLHGALCAAVVMSSAAADRDTFTITSPISLRNMLGIDTRNCGLLVGVGTVRFSLQQPRGFWALARQMVADLAPARTADGVLAALGGLESKLPPDADGELASGLIGAMQYDAIVSNLGALPIAERVGSVHLKAFWGPFVQGRFTNERVIGAASVGGRLHITQTTPRHIPSFLEDLSRILIGACVTAP